MSEKKWMARQCSNWSTTCSVDMKQQPLSYSFKIHIANAIHSMCYVLLLIFDITHIRTSSLYIYLSLSFFLFRAHAHRTLSHTLCPIRHSFVSFAFILLFSNHSFTIYLSFNVLYVTIVRVLLVKLGLHLSWVNYLSDKTEWNKLYCHSKPNFFTLLICNSIIIIILIGNIISRILNLTQSCHFFLRITTLVIILQQFNENYWNTCRFIY